MLNLWKILMNMIVRINNCPCCSGKSFGVCCEPLITGSLKATTAEQLMRSRYSAYATGAIAYILATTHHSTRDYYSADSIQEWAAESTWQKLEIVSTEKGSALDLIGYVQFKAYFLDAHKKAQIHHEYSTFNKIDAVWYFVDGKIVS